MDGAGDHRQIFVQIQGLEIDLGATARAANAFAEAGDVHAGVLDVLHVLQHGGVQLLVHEDKAAEALDDGEKVVQLVREAAQKFLMKAVPRLLGEIQQGGIHKLHGTGRGRSISNHNSQVI